MWLAYKISSIRQNSGDEYSAISLNVIHSLGRISGGKCLFIEKRREFHYANKPVISQSVQDSEWQTKYLAPSIPFLYYLLFLREAANHSRLSLEVVITIIMFS